MRKTIWMAGAAVALLGVLALKTDSAAVGADRTLTAAFGIKQEPILNFDVTGSTLTGPFHARLTVYNNGLITESECGGFFGNNNAGTAFTSMSEVEKLRKELIDAGGMKLPDQNISVADIPLTTVTVFNGDTDAKAHTFSYWVGFGNYAKINQIVADFRAKNPTSCSSIILSSE